MAQLCDPITQNPTDQEGNKECWRQVTAKFVQELLPGPLDSLCQAVYRHLDDESRGRGGEPPKVPLCDHAPDSYLPDHLLLTSAIAYCLGYGQGGIDLNLLRLAAMAHDFPDDARQGLVADLSPADQEALKSAWVVLDAQRSWLERVAGGGGFPTEVEAKPPDGDFALVLWQAHLVASASLGDMKVTGEERERWVPSSKDGFDRHPLVGVKTKVGLVYGGATKIKGYVFESAKLPEIRGASALFDRINLLDLPALWGRQPGQEEWENKLTEAQQRYEAVRRSFDPDAPLAPECIVYANGGNVLAFAPVSLLERLTTEIEHIYNDQTLVGQSAAVGGQFSLLELQYGMCPQEYWIEEYTADLQDEKASLLLGAYYGRSGDSETATFLRKKTFGELVTWLSNEQNRRREERQSIPHFETMPHVRRCFSCDRRGAVAKRVVDGVENYYCEPCARKLIFGLLTKRQEPEAVEDAKKWWREQGFTWRPLAARSWIDVFDQYLAESHQGEGYYKGQEPRVPKDLEDIAETAKPDGYIGVLYGDGNGVGTYIERITTPAQYRQFASRLYQAVQTSVFEAMRVHLLPTQDIYPFEILNIGGDDVFLIVPANKALPVAHAVAQKVEALLGTKVEPAREKMVPANERYALPDANGQPQRVVEAYKPQITLSAGVVIADAKTPIFMLKGLVDELLKEAKRWRKTRVYDGGMVDFLTLKATSMIVSGVKEFRKSALYQEGKERLWFTARPYTLHELQGLLQTVREFKQQEFPRSQLYALRRMIFGGKRLASTIDYLYFRLRLKEQPAKVIGLHFDRAWHRQPEVLPPWQRREKLDEYETVLPDIVELYDFVEKEEG